MRGHLQNSLLILFLCVFPCQSLLLSQAALAKPAPSASSQRQAPKPHYVLSLEQLPRVAASTTPSTWGWVVYNEGNFARILHPKKPLLAVTSLNSPILLRWAGHLPHGSRLDYAQPGFIIPDFKYDNQEVGLFIQFCRRRGVQVVFLPVA